MKYAVIASGGKQYKVSEGTVLEVDKLDVTPGSELSFDKVLLTVDGDTINIGTPYLQDIRVLAMVLEQTKGEKIRVLQFKAKARHRRTIGFRAKLTKMKITSLDGKAINEIKDQKANLKNTDKK